MKKLIFLFSFICIAATVALCQDQQQSYDSSFRELYKTIALHPGYINGRGIITKPVIRKWDKDITIFIEGGSRKNRREIVAKLENTIAVISPALDNKIKILFTNDKSSANYLIDLSSGAASGWYLRWDNLGNIYNCVIQLNTYKIFNQKQLIGMASHYFLKSLGDFITITAPPVASNLASWMQDINEVDLQILKLHYSSDIKPGMTWKDVDKVFSTHND
jgi:hypothetical protein